MNAITISGKEYSLREEQGLCEVEFYCDDTQLQRVLCFKAFPTFDFEQRRVVSQITQYDITPSGLRINPVSYRYTLTEADFTDFENSIGVIMKKAIMNGIFRNVIQNTYAVYDAGLNLIGSENQPVPYPQT